MLVRWHKILIIASAVATGFAFGAEALIADVSISGQNFAAFWAGKYLDIVESTAATAPETQSFDKSRILPPQGKDVPGFGYTSGEYAARLNAVNTSTKDIEVGVIAYGPIEAFHLRQVVHGQVVSSQDEGLQLPLPEQPTFSMFRYPHFKLTLRPGLNQLYFGERAVAQHFPVMIMAAPDFQELVSSQTTSVTAFFALSTAILIMSILLLLIFRDRVSGLYFASFASSFLLDMYVTGALRPILYQVLGRQSFAAAAAIEHVLYNYWIVWWGLTGVSAALFGQHTLKITLSGRSPATLLVKVAVAGSALLSVGAFVNGAAVINIFSPLQQLAVLLFVGKSFQLWRKGHQPALFSLLGWGVYSAATTVQLCYFFGLIAPSMVASWGMAIGTLCQFFFLGVGVFWERKFRETVNRQQLNKNFRELAARDEIIQEFTSPKILSEISLGMDPRLYKSRWQELSILYSDMRNFTHLIENADLAWVEEVLNSYMGEIIDCTIEHNGEVNKLIGDAILCVYDSPAICLAACVEMRKRLSAMNRLKVSQGKNPIKFGTGASHARVISMNIGRFGKRLDRTVIGDEVNITARIESLTKTLATDVLVSEHFQEHIKDYPYQRALGSFLLKGKTESTVIYEIFGHNTEKVIDYKLSTKEQLQVIAGLCQVSQHADALRLIDELIKACPDHSFARGQKLDTTLMPLRMHIVESMQAVDEGRGDGKQSA